VTAGCLEILTNESVRMYQPQPNDVPSEQTIEVLSDHFILEGLQIPTAWMFCPTRVQEQRLGYDGSLQNGKILIIQYKRVIVNQGVSVRVDIDQVQMNTLLANFPQGTFPYVFYGFSTYRDYGQLDAGFRAAGGQQFFANMLFVDLHVLPANCNSLTYSPQNGVQPNINGIAQPAVAFINGDQLVNGLDKCTTGISLTEFESLAGGTGRSVTWTPFTPNTSILIWE
jgi:prepilin-type processing-associated H-X9-DG protein